MNQKRNTPGGRRGSVRFSQSELRQKDLPDQAPITLWREEASPFSSYGVSGRKSGLSKILRGFRGGLSLPADDRELQKSSCYSRSGTHLQIKARVQALFSKKRGRVFGGKASVPLKGRGESQPRRKRGSLSKSAREDHLLAKRSFTKEKGVYFVMPVKGTG